MDPTKEVPAGKDEVDDENRRQQPTAPLYPNITETDLYESEDGTMQEETEHDHQHDNPTQHHEHESTETDCPICMEALDFGEEAMRCTGQGGVRHLFHAHCLKEWALSCRRRGVPPSCPVCRGGVQVHSRRLEQFLTSPEAETLDHESRGMLHNLLQGVRERLDVGSEWSQPLTSEQLLSRVGLIASAGIGFLAGYRGSVIMHNVSQDLMYLNGNQTARVVNAVGFVAGVITRAVFGRSENENRRTRR